MTKRQRKTLIRLRDVTAEFQQYIPYVHNRTIIEIFDYICTVIYTVLVDCDGNEQLDYDLEQAEESLKKFEDL